MSSSENSIQFYLNILEISGKQVTNTYVNNLQKYMNDKGLKYKFEIVTDEDFFIRHKHTTRGGNSTFPYKHFESAFDNVKNMISFDNSIKSDEITQTEDIKPTEIVNIDYSKQSSDETSDLNNTNDIVNTKENATNKNQITDTIIDRLTVYKPLELNGNNTNTHQSTLTLTNLNIPDDYDGVIHIMLTIYKDNANNDVIQGGITQLNHFLRTV